jgi:hypothetical protein
MRTPRLSIKAVVVEHGRLLVVRAAGETDNRARAGLRRG